MNIGTILSRALVGKKIISYQKFDDGTPLNSIMTIHTINGFDKGVMIVTCSFHPLDGKKSDPFFDYPIDLYDWDFETINTE